jgi:hypothetical protein
MSHPASAKRQNDSRQPSAAALSDEACVDLKRRLKGGACAFSLLFRRLIALFATQLSRRLAMFNF